MEGIRNFDLLKAFRYIERVVKCGKDLYYIIHAQTCFELPSCISTMPKFISFLSDSPTASYLAFIIGLTSFFKTSIINNFVMKKELRILYIDFIVSLYDL